MKPPRYLRVVLFVIILISFTGFSQTNETLINQATQAVQSQNITTRSQAVDALKANGMTETQARQLASQRGISYDQLINELFPNENSENPIVSFQEPGTYSISLTTSNSLMTDEITKNDVINVISSEIVTEDELKKLEEDAAAAEAKAIADAAENNKPADDQVPTE